MTVISTLGVVTVFGLILEKLETVINTNLYKSIGSAAVLFTALIGTPLHEIAHWSVCKLFEFNIIDVELLRPIAYKKRRRFRLSSGNPRFFKCRDESIKSFTVEHIFAII